MKKVLYILLLLPVLVVSQNASTETTAKTNSSNVEVNTIVKNNITATFSKPTVLAYQEKAIASIIDFYNYINYYQNTEENQLLEKEIDKSIENLFLNEKLTVKDVFSESLNTISLEQFLNKCKSNKVKVSVSNFNQNNVVFDTYFTFTYDLEVTFKGKRTNQNITQKVYFFPGLKNFGDQQKNVWQLKLGEF